MPSVSASDPGLFGYEVSQRGFAQRTIFTGWRGPEYPPEWDQEPTEQAAPYCEGPGHLYRPDPINYDRTPGDLLIRIEDCPECIGLIRNHHNSRKETE